jgi:AraC-like DNA-binding protein
MLLLDTTEVPRADRADAFADAMRAMSSPCRVDLRDPSDEMRVRMSVWPYGPSTLVRTDATRFRMARTARHVRMDGEPAIGVSFQSAGHGEFAQFGHEQLVRGDDLMLVDMGSPYAFGCAHGGGARLFIVPAERLGLPTDLVRAAAPRLRASPLHDVVHRHLEEVAASVERLSGDPGAASLGAATVELVRALVVSASGDDRHRAEVRENSLLARVRAFVRQRLADPRLTADVIAAAHNVSVRRLYALCAEAGLSLEQWIITERLEAARSALISPAGLHRTIAATARACGFADASHFSRRFRNAYGVTPREWQRIATDG